MALFLDGEMILRFTRCPTDASRFQTYRIGRLCRLCDGCRNGKRPTWVSAVRHWFTEVVALDRQILAQTRHPVLDGVQHRVTFASVGIVLAGDVAAQRERLRQGADHLAQIPLPVALWVLQELDKVRDTLHVRLVDGVVYQR
ncbi:hypothetical protein D3C84_741950 [compost metagenome]